MNNGQLVLQGSRVFLSHNPISDEKHYIIKHFIFGSKCKPGLFMASMHGKAHSVATPKVGKKILQYTLENLGCHQFNIFDLQTSDSKNTNTRFEDKTDEEVDAGFDYIATEGLRSSREMQRWMTKAIKNSSFPTSVGRTVSLKKPFAISLLRPIPFTSTFCHTWILDIFERIWDFDTSALVLLGEAGAGKLPLGRLLMAQVRHNQVADFLDDTTIKWPSSKMLNPSALGCCEMGAEPASSRR